MTFRGKTAIVTGGASGIGRALCAGLLESGATVVIADFDAAALELAVDELSASFGENVSGRKVDVTDRDAVRSLVEDNAARSGGIDYLFNNAGISLGGPTHEMSGAHWDAIIETNLVGVVNGLLAAYPLMVAQGRGHIVNTASAAGLAAPPFVTAYATTKHAVVGMSTGLRAEAALHGVRVTVLCPGAVDTAILDRPPAADLPQTASEPVTARAYLTRLHQRPMTAERFASRALRDVSRNRAISVIPRSANALWYLHRLSPALVSVVMKSMANTVATDLVRPRVAQ